MICRLALHESTPGPITSPEARSFRSWVKSQPGFVAGWHGADPQTGRMVSVTIWESDEALAALKDKHPPGGPLGMKPAQIETFPVVEAF
jgi:hypothetical protein